MTHPDPQDQSTPSAATDRPPAKQHGDPLLAASEGASEGTEGTRHGYDATDPEQGQARARPS